MRVDTGHTERSAEDALPEWTRRLAAGEEEAWHWFHERYYLPLLRYAAHCGGDPSAASEIVQQSYLRIARHVKPFAGEDAFWGWLCCVVRCVAVDHARHITRRTALLEKFAHWRAAQSATDAALLRRKYCDGWSVEELAASHGTTAKAIEHRIARLRERLREIILRLR